MSRRIAAQILLATVLLALLGGGIFLGLWRPAKSSRAGTFPPTASPVATTASPTLLDALTPEELRSKYFEDEISKDHALNEFVRRGEQSGLVFLTDEWLRSITNEDGALEERQHCRQVTHCDEPLDTEIHNPFNLQLITAIRRMRHLPDPVVIEVSFPNGNEFRQGESLLIRVALRNIDDKGTPIRVRVGSDDYAHWRMEVRNEAGWVLPHVDCVPTSRLYWAATSTLHFGLTPSVALALDRYVPDLQPNTYVGVVHYHDVIPINDRATIDGLITCKSEPFRFRVKPR